MNNLKRSMKVVRFLRFFTGLEWFFSLLALIGSAISFFSLLTLQALNKTELIMQIENASGTPVKAITAIALISVIICFFSLVLSGASKRYYKGVIEAGTPFTEGGADDMRSLGWKHLLLPIAVSILADAVAMAFGIDSYEITLTVSGSGIGFVYLFVAPFIRYGAELEREKKLNGIG